MKQLLDFLPLVVFFAVYQLYDIYTATGALIVASAIQLLALYVLYKQIEKMHWITFGLVTVFGALTLFFQNDAFIKWKVTLVYALFAIALIVGQLMNKSILKAMLGKELVVEDSIWAKVTWYWVGFFALCGALNVYIAFNLSQETWVNFKVFGLTALTLVNTIITIAYLYKHLPEDKRNQLK